MTATATALPFQQGIFSYTGCRKQQESLTRAQYSRASPLLVT